MNCFISGAITNVPNYLELFERAQNEVVQLGFTPFNPAAVTQPLVAAGVELSEDKWLNICFEAVKACDIVYHLMNWKNSNGAKKEHAVALAYSKPILYQESLGIYLMLKERGADIYKIALDSRGDN